MPGKNTVKTWLSVVALIILDQAIKLVIKANFLQLHFDIVDGFLYFQPLHNTKLSWINSLLGTNVGFLPHIITNTIILILLVWGYRYAESIRSIPLPMRYSYIFILAGATCSVIDKIFWGGSLDFIGLFSWFIFDTKDFFITVGITIFAVHTIFFSNVKPKVINTGAKDDMQVVKDFIGFMGKDVGRLYGKFFGRHVE